MNNLILNQTNFPKPFVSVIQQEAAKALGVSLNAPAAVNLANTFAAAELLGVKGGGIFAVNRFKFHLFFHQHHRRVFRASHENSRRNDGLSQIFFLRVLVD